MQVRWWQSIRWRLAIGSLLVSLLATTLLAISVIVAVNYYYGVDQRQRLTSLASDMAQRIGVHYRGNLGRAVFDVLPNTPQQNAQNQDYLILVLSNSQPVRLIYPYNVRNAQTARLTAILIAATDPTVKQGDYARLFNAVASARRGITVVDQLGQSGPGVAPRLFVAQPIFENSGAVVGMLIVMPRSAAEGTVPQFLVTVTTFVFIAAIIVATIATLVALLFSRTITRPLARLTSTARVLASGDYSARVQTGARSELGELAGAVNEMAARLERDVEELRRQEAWRRELIMNITHDLATPLTAIAGLGESLVDGVNQTREDYEETGRVIVRETLRLRRLVRDLHMMAKVEAGAVQPQGKAVRLASLADEALAVLAPEFERANVEPRNLIPYTLPVVWADPDMLMRVFSNLCDNALRYTPPGGTVTIEAQQQGHAIEVAVIDSGPGIPPGALDRIFDRFYRADNSRQARTGGSGLGLAIVRAIIEAHGGTIRAENVPQGGARIVFTLPLPTFTPDQLASMTTLPIK